MSTPAAVPDTVWAALEHASERGWLSEPLLPHLEHSAGFHELVPPEAELLVDLGSGGGVPGLAVASWRPRTQVVLVESQLRRAEHLREAAAAAGLAEVVVAAERAEVVARDPRWRERADVVLARSFGPPAVVAECGVPLLRPGGVLLVSEPPIGVVEHRWPPEQLAAIGAAPAVLTRARGRRYVVIERTGPVPASLPRRPGLPGKRPRWR